MNPTERTSSAVEIGTTATAAARPRCRPGTGRGRPSLGPALVALALLAGGCASAGGSRPWWPEKERWGEALRHAARSPATWAPAAGAAAVAAGGWDTQISDWARRETPVFGSQAKAETASDDLLWAANLGMVVTALGAPQGGREATRGEMLVFEEGLVLVDAALVDGIKRATGRERPRSGSQSSFPSGHSAGAFASATLAGRNLRWSAVSPKKRRLFTGGIGALAVGSAWARVEAGAHYPSDVLAGAAVGHFLSAMVHDAWFGTGSEPIVALEVGPKRQAISIRLSF